MTPTHSHHLADVYADLYEQAVTKGTARTTLAKGLHILVRYRANGARQMVLTRTADTAPSALEAKTCAEQAGFPDFRALPWTTGKGLPALVVTEVLPPPITGADEPEEPEEAAQPPAPALPNFDRNLVSAEILAISANRGEFWTWAQVVEARTKGLAAMTDQELHHELVLHRRFYKRPERAVFA